MHLLRVVVCDLTNFYYFYVLKQMYIMKYFIFTILLACLLSCSDSKHKAILDQAELLIDQQPDSAYVLLSPIYIDDIRGEKNKARFALLYSETLDKNYIDVKDDSLARFAVAYYADNGTDIEKATAYYYLARVHENASDIEQCIANLTLASECVPEDSYYLKGLIYSLFGRSCYDQFDQVRAIEYNEKAIIAYQSSGNKYNHASALSNIANSYGLLKDYDNALSSELKALDIYVQLKDTAEVVVSFESIAMWNLTNNQPIKHVKQNLFKVYNKYNSSNKYPINYWLLSEIYTKEGKIDSVIYYLKHDLSRYDTTTLVNKASYYYKLGEIEALKNNDKKARKYDAKAQYSMNSFYIKNLSKTTQELAEKYKNVLYKKSLIEAEREKRYYMYIFILSLLVFFSLIYILINRYRSRLKNLDRDLCLAQEVLETLSNSKAIIEEQYNQIKEQNISNIATERDLATLDNLHFIMVRFNNLIENLPKYDKKPRKFIDEFIALMRDAEKIDSKTFLYEIINRQYNGALDSIKDKYALEQYEIYLYSMVCMGFSNSAMRILFDHTNDKTIYNYRSVLKTKLGVVINKENLITLLNG